ncbi:Mu-like prophage protein gp29 [Cohaesibacter sp. ES.047]|uniref:DUF935 domain-containing protein n=1 Tax=Cohaesibacter sp. ES.047 TaxID=1798205 RepID=UPI000BB68F6A|nr:DUF935 domain-containing protein [Cohaesibacter sp. ES.047]SNY91384.1 Mu-like prophage protein gp29 [Cohaesibacter sp. ES.047]
MAEQQAVIYDLYGKPMRVEKKALASDTVPVRNFTSKFTESFSSEITPQRLKRILASAANGQPDEFLKMAELMEEEDAHYAAVLGSRKRAVSSIEPVIEHGGEGPKASEIGAAVEQLIEQPQFYDMLDDALDALGKGYAVIEQTWSINGKYLMPSVFTWLDPRLFMFAKEQRKTLRLKVDGDVDGEELMAGKFIVHMPRLKSGLQIRTGLARVAAWAYMLKSFTLRGWAGYNEVFGMPLRIGKYDKASSYEDRATLLRAVVGIANDAAGIIDKNMDIEFISNPSRGGDSVFEKFAEYLDKQISKGVLGQTMTTDDGSSLAQAQVHNEVRIDIQQSDARQLAATINRDVIRPFVDINFGQQDRYPKFTLPISVPEDLKLMSETLENLVPLGLEVSMAEVRERISFSDPDKNAVLLKSPGSTTKAEKLNRQVALARKKPSIEFDDIGLEELDAWEEQLGPMIEPIQLLAKSAGSKEEFIAGLAELVSTMDDEAMSQAIVDAGQKAHAFGDDKG